MIIVVATRNQGKAREFAEMLGDSGPLDWRDLSHFPAAGEVDETGHTFRANACLKASEYARRLGHHTIADDSGLEVDALDGSPGVYSARWAQMHDQGKGDADNNRLLLSQLNDVPDDKRSARFVCALALSDPQGRILLTVRDTVEGRILRELRGSNGFGYDPMFLIDALGRTTAELSSDQKHAISHRGKALRRMKELMKAIVPNVFPLPGSTGDLRLHRQSS